MAQSIGHGAYEFMPMRTLGSAGLIPQILKRDADLADPEFGCIA
jgi:hypothetical protein